MFMKKICSVLLSMCMAFGICSAAAEGTTGDELVVHESIVFDLQSYNILRDDENGNLRLEESISRAEFCGYEAYVI